MKTLPLSLMVISTLVLCACSGGGGGGNGGAGILSAASTKLTISGTVDSQVTIINGTSSNPVKGANVNIVDASGNSQMVQTDTAGHYSAQVNKLTIYGVTVTMPTSSKPGDKPGERSGSSPVYMKAVAETGSSNYVLNINPGTTAAVLVLQKEYSITIGNASAPIGTKLDNIDVDATVTNIYSYTNFQTLAAAVATDVKNNIDPSSDSNVTNTLLPPVVSVVNPIPTSTAVCPSGQTMTSGVCVVTSGVALVGAWQFATSNGSTMYSTGTEPVNDTILTFTSNGTFTFLMSGAGYYGHGICQTSGTWTATANAASTLVTGGTGGDHGAGCLNPGDTWGLANFNYTISGNALTITNNSVSAILLTPPINFNSALVGNYSGLLIGTCGASPCNGTWSTTASSAGIITGTLTLAGTPCTILGAVNPVAINASQFGLNGNACNGAASMIGTVDQTTGAVTGTFTIPALSVSGTMNGTKQ